MSDMAMSPSERMEWNGATCWIYHHPPCYILSMGRMKCVTLEFLSSPPTFPNRELFVRRGGEKEKERVKRQRWNNKLCVFLPRKKRNKTSGSLGLGNLPSPSSKFFYDFSLAPSPPPPPLHVGQRQMRPPSFFRAFVSPCSLALLHRLREEETRGYFFS